MRAEWDVKPELMSKKRVCEKCGKEFVPAVFHQYVDYIHHNHKKLYFCSYTCYCHRKKPSGRRGGKIIQAFNKKGELVREFPNAQQAALWLTDRGYYADNRLIQRCCRGELKTYCGFIFKYKEVTKE